MHIRGYDAFVEYKTFILSKLDERFILIYNTKNKIMKKECVLIGTHLKNSRFHNNHIEIAELEIYDSMGGNAGLKISICIISSVNLETLLRMIGRRGNVEYNRVILEKNVEPNTVIL